MIFKDLLVDLVGVGVLLVELLVLVGDGDLLFEGVDGSGEEMGCLRRVGYVLMLVIML